MMGLIVVCRQQGSKAESAEREVVCHFVRCN